MKILNWEDFLDSPHNQAASRALTIGSYDGVHRGHQALLRTIIATGLKPTVLSFASNPKAIIHPNSYSGDIMSQQQKIEQLKAMGIDLVVLIDFSPIFATMPGKEFLSLLKKRQDLAFIAVGSNFLCGHKLDTSAATLKSYMEAASIPVEIIPPVRVYGEIVSSSRIRKELAAGNIQLAAKLLGRYYEVDLEGSTVVSTDHSNTHNLQQTGRIVPGDGQYSVILINGDTKSSKVFTILVDQGMIVLPKESIVSRVRFLTRL